MDVDRQRNRRRHARRILPVGLVAVSALAASALAFGHSGAGTAAAPAGGPEGVTITPLVHATIPDKVRARGQGISIRTKGPRDVLGTSIDVVPGGSFGWHTHPGPVLVAVAAGTLTLYESHHGKCSKHKVGPGEGFIEAGDHVHNARNEGSEPVRLYATFLARKGTENFLVTVPDPGTCHIAS
jgi:quercetin dioxygenase-like cupin family protein